MEPRMCLGVRVGRTTLCGAVLDSSNQIVQVVDGAASGPRRVRKIHDELHCCCPSRMSFSDSPCLISALQSLKADAQRQFGRPILDAVFSVPLDCNDVERTAVRAACESAGFTVHRGLNEPVAAAIAYELDTNTSSSDTAQSILVFDLGASSLHVSLLVLEDDILEVVSSVEEPAVGGNVFDLRICNYFESMLNHRATVPMMVLRSAAEQARCELSVESESVAVVDSVALRLSRARFEALIGDDTERAIVAAIERALKDARKGKHEIDHVVMAGGCSRTPKVRAIVARFFDDKNLAISINPDETTAYGAAKKGCQLVGHATQPDIVFMEYIPLSLGISTPVGVMAKIIPRMFTIPVKRSMIVTTSYDDQTEMSISILEGERVRSCDNRCLGTLELRGISAAPRGSAHIEVVFEIDPNGVLSVHAAEVQEGGNHACGASLVISNEENRLSVKEIDALLKESELHRAKDEEILKELLKDAEHDQKEWEFV